jgi:glucosamine-6-phosphate deaminase
VVCASAAEAGRYGAAEVSAALNQVLAERARARLLLSTGQSQFEVLSNLVRSDVDWRRVDVFHLDEYVGLGADHPASFRRYLRERVADIVPVDVHYVEPSSREAMEEVAEAVSAAPIDVALVGVGENGHIAFNDPPADMETEEPYILVQLDAACRAQQVGEGWFATAQDVPSGAVTMSVRQILLSRAIVSVVPRAAKARAVARLMAADAVSAELPASALLGHPDWCLVLDRASAQSLPAATWRRCIVL